MGQHHHSRILPDQRLQYRQAAILAAVVGHEHAEAKTITVGKFPCQLCMDGPTAAQLLEVFLLVEGAAHESQRHRNQGLSLVALKQSSHKRARSGQSKLILRPSPTQPMPAIQ